MNLKRFLVSLGYLEKTKTKDKAAVKRALKKAQKFYGIRATGELDSLTRSVLGSTRRCAVPDYHAARGAAVKWGKTHLVYHIVDYVRGAGLTKADVTSITRDSFQMWGDVSLLTFEESRDIRDADIPIYKGRGRRVGLDGPGGTLAYAYLPTSAQHDSPLEIVLDQDEPWWKEFDSRFVKLLAVLAHEIGHTLGHDHDDTPNQLMNPYYSPIDSLQNNDVKRTVKLYGKAAVAPPPGGVGIDKIEMLLRINGKKTFGPYDLDLSKSSSMKFPR